MFLLTLKKEEDKEAGNSATGAFTPVRQFQLNEASQYSKKQNIFSIKKKKFDEIKLLIKKRPPSHSDQVQKTA